MDEDLNPSLSTFVYNPVIRIHEYLFLYLWYASTREAILTDLWLEGAF